MAEKITELMEANQFIFYKLHLQSTNTAGDLDHKTETTIYSQTFPPQA